MKRLLLGGAVLGLWFGSPAIGADLRPVLKAPPPVPVYNWTGCYVGAGGGYGMYNKDRQLVSDAVNAVVGDPAVNPIVFTNDQPPGTLLGPNETFGGRGW